MINGLAILISLAFATGCSNSKTAKSEVDTNQLLGKEWKLIEVKDKMVPQDSKAGFMLTIDRKVIGSTGCNRMNGTYELIKNREIKFGPIATTRMACPEDEVNEIERLFTEAISSTNSWNIENDVLLLLDGKKVVAKLNKGEQSAGLNGSWELNFITGPRITFEGLYPDKKPTMIVNLSDSSASGNSSCNSYTVPMEVDGQKISFGEGLATLMACEGDGETVFFQTLRKVKSYKLSEDKNILELLLDGVPMMRFMRK